MPVKQDTEELRYALRSFKNLDYDDLIIVGYKPKWVKSALHISISETFDKHENITRCIETALNWMDGDFIIAEDDHYVMQPTDLPDEDRGPIKVVMAWQSKRFGGEYLRGMQYAHRVAPGKSYELHRPMKFNKDKLQLVFDKYRKEGSFQYRTIYGNYWKLDSKTVKDYKVRDKENYTKWPFISSSNDNFKRLQPFLESNFPHKSRHE